MTYQSHTHTSLTALFPGLPGWAGTRKVKPIWILLKQETASGSGISWAICKSAPSSRQVTMPAPHHSRVLQARCPSCRPTNSVKALKALKMTYQSVKIKYDPDILWSAWVVHLRQLLYWLLDVLEVSVDDVDAVRHWISNVLLHETAKARQVRRDVGNSHHRAFRCKQHATFSHKDNSGHC